MTEWNLSHRKYHYIAKDAPTIAQFLQSTDDDDHKNDDHHNNTPAPVTAVVHILDISNNYLFRVTEEDVCHLFQLSPTISPTMSPSPQPHHQYTHLIKLNLSANNLDAIPNGLHHLPHLQYLQLSNNRITRLSPELQHVKQLRYLDLRFNRISQLEHLDGLHRLEKLTMSSNQLTRLDGLPVHQLRHLRFLGLFGNRLDDLEHVKQVLAPLGDSLQYLYLSANPMCPVPIIDNNNNNDSSNSGSVQQQQHHPYDTILFQHLLPLLPHLLYFNDVIVSQNNVLSRLSSTAARVVTSDGADGDNKSVIWTTSKIHTIYDMWLWNTIY